MVIIMKIIRRCLSSSPSFLSPSNLEVSTFRCIDMEGNILPGSEHYVESLSKDLILKIYGTMIQVQEFDTVFYELQRQGVVSFYMQNTGEEGLQVASAAALEKDDWVMPQYRELGVFFWRDFSIQQACHQMFGNIKDLGEGKQMPIHYGSLEAKIHTVSSPLGTQIPQASGIGYALRMNKQANVAACYFGEGAASEGDAHAAMNFASTLNCYTLFLCRNNLYAISTPIEDQYKSDGIITRAIGYGMPGLRIDGNDIFAVYHGTKIAREMILERQQPVLIEYMTYRRGHHSTSDDATRYRDKKEIEYYETVDNPIKRLEKYMKKAGILDFEPSEHARFIRQDILAKKEVARKELLPNWSVMFDNVYDEVTPLLEKQREELKVHLDKHGKNYGMNAHA